jgi:hypothetical protein
LYDSKLLRGRIDLDLGDWLAPSHESLHLVPDMKFGVKIKILNPFFVDEWRPIIKLEQIQIIGIFFKCELIDDEKIKLSDDHDDYKWVDKENYYKLPLIEATRRALDEFYSK